MARRLIVYLGKFGICATVGGMAGGITGLILGAMLRPLSAHHVPLSVAAITGALIGVVAWIVILWILTVIGHFVFGDVALPALFTSLLVSIIVALVVDALDGPSISMLLGWFIGFVIGALLCELCGIATARRTT